MWKTLLRKCVRNICKHWREIAEHIVIGVLFVGFFVGGYMVRGVEIQEEISFWRSLLLAPEPERCAICENEELLPGHAPVLVNLASGEAERIQGCRKNFYPSCTFGEEYLSDTFSFFRCAGLQGYIDTGDNKCVLHLPSELKRLEAEYFCYACRCVLAQASTEGFVVLDMHGSDMRCGYPVIEGNVFEIEDYIISVEKVEGTADLIFKIQIR